MKDKPVTLVDSCALLDIFNNDEQWCDWSVSMLYEKSQKFSLIINPIIFTEIAFNFNSYDQLCAALKRLDIQIQGIPLQVSFNVSRTFAIYRKNKGTKTSPMPDFYIGAHAQFLKAPLITRNIAKFKTYYPQVELIHPSI